MVKFPRQRLFEIFREQNSENNFKVIPKFTEQDIIQAVNFDMVSDHVIKTFVPPAFRPLFFIIKK